MKKTSKHIALEFCEKFQENYPTKKPLWKLMVELEKEIDQLVKNKMNDDTSDKSLKLGDLMASDLADNEDFQKQLLKHWGFTNDGGIDVKNQLKIFDVLDWIRKNGNKQHYYE